MRTNKRAIFTLILIFSTLCLLGQNEKKVGVVLISKHSKEMVWLRWAPTSPLAWETTNANGWWLERVLIPTDTEPGDTSYTLLTTLPIKPLPLEEWEHPSDTSNSAAIAAQVLYGETLDITTPTSAMQLIDKNRELESRFSFGLTAAEHEFTVAQMMGLGFIDRDVLPQRTYIYRVYANITDSISQVDTAGVVVNLKEKYELPRVFDLMANVRDTTITLQWPAGYHRGIYSTYNIEKSVEGEPFAVINDLPLANMFSGGQSDFNHFFSDVHLADGETLYYRVRGITPFGDVGPPSDSVKVLVPLLFPIPSNLKYSEIPESNIAIAWEYPEEFTEKVRSFEVLGSASFKGEPKYLGTFSPTNRSAILKTPSSEMYISVVAVGLDGTKRNSYPMMIQLADSMPPSPATNLKGRVTKEGRAQINWKWGSEPDLFGYRVYAATNPNAEFSLISKDFVRDSVFSWDIPLNTLTRKIHVKLMTYDYRYNYSPFSQTLKLTLPDTIPPSAPMLQVCERTANGVRFVWVRSGSTDVASHALVYQTTGATTQDTIKIFNGTERGYVWNKPVEGVLKFYVVAIDSSGNSTHSIQNFQLNLTGIGFANFSPKLSVNKNIANGQIELSWTSHSSATKAIIYRSVNGEAYRTFNAVNENVFLDKNITIGNSYGYMLRFQNPNGEMSMNSNEVEITF